MSIDLTKSPKYFLGDPILAGELFCGLTRRGRGSLERIKQKLEFGEKVTVLARGDQAESLFVLRSGKARLLIDTGFEDGRIARPVRPGELLGLTESLASSTYETTVETTSRCCFDLIRSEDFMRFLRSEPELCFHLLKLLGTDLQRGRLLITSA